MEERIKQLEEEIEKIQQRNKRVEKDKMWETSLARRLFIALSTYVLVVVLLISIGNGQPFLNAIIPACAYLISTASIGILKSWWLEKKRE